jgi:hypothetical protein
VRKPAFERSVIEMRHEALRLELLALIDARVDSLRIDRPAAPKEQFCECLGARRDVDFEGPLVV